MSDHFRRSAFIAGIGIVILTGNLSVAVAQTTPGGSRQFAPGTLQGISQLPAGRFRAQIEQLKPAAQSKTLEWLRRFHLPETDARFLQVDKEGGVFYADEFLPTQPAVAETEPTVSEAAVPVEPLPQSLKFHSRPGAPNVLYLNFCGEMVTGTAWNNSLNRLSIPAVAFSTDSDFETFSDSEQLAIKRIWQRVAEDFAPFDVDVTTERPENFNNRTAHALITRNTDANGQNNPSAGSGGVAYVTVFAQGNYSYYRPAWVYYNNLSSSEAHIAEATSHELGHNLGLSHDGLSSGASYYGGHGSGDTSWGPIMGTGYNRNVSQWSKGDYYLANNTQDDLSILAGKLSYRTDDHGNTFNDAEPLTLTGGTNVVSTKPEGLGADLINKGVIERNNDVDVFTFVTGPGRISLTVNPWIMPANTKGGNLDLVLELYDQSGALLLSTNASGLTSAAIQPVLAEGRYYLQLRNTGVGDPLSSSPNGYLAYGSIGQYFIDGYLVQTNQTRPPTEFTLNTSVNNPSWGSVTPGGAYGEDTLVAVLATPATYYRFANWSGSVTSTNNPVSLTMDANKTLQANFTERLTTNHATPHWWLASYGITQNLETEVNRIGSNGMPIWQSYIAGLNPNNPNSQLRLTVTPAVNDSNVTLKWDAVAGRVYTILSSTNLSNGFAPLPNATDLPATVTSYTNAVNPAAPWMFYRIEVSKQ